MVDLTEQTPPLETPPPPPPPSKRKAMSTSRSTRSTTSSAALRASRETENTGRVTRSSKKDEPKIVAPQTPASTNMDSDDDFRSVASSDAFDEAEDQDSDASIEAGM